MATEQLQIPPGENLTGVLRGVIIFFIAASTLIFFGRLYTRLVVSKNAGLDDAVATLAFIVVVSESSVEVAGAPGSGKPLMYINKAWMPQFFQLIFAAQMLYLFASGIIRLSILAFLPRLNHFDRFRRLLIGVGVFIIVQTATFFIVALVLYQPSKDTVQRTPTSMARTSKAEMQFYVSHQGIGMGIDLFLLATPLWIIYSNLLQTKQNIGVILIFSVGVFEIAVDCVRLAMLRQIGHQNGRSLAFFYVSLLTTMELHIGLWVACFPALVPLLRIGWQHVCSTLSNVTTPRTSKTSRACTQGKHRSISKKNSSNSIGTNETALTELGYKSSSDNLETFYISDERVSESGSERKVNELCAV